MSSICAERWRSGRVAVTTKADILHIEAGRCLDRPTTPQSRRRFAPEGFVWADHPRFLQVPLEFDHCDSPRHRAAAMPTKPPCKALRGGNIETHNFTFATKPSQLVRLQIEIRGMCSAGGLATALTVAMDELARWLRYLIRHGATEAAAAQFGRYEFRLVHILSSCPLWLV